MGPAALCWDGCGGKCEVSASLGGVGDRGRFQGVPVHAAGVLGLEVWGEAYFRPPAMRRPPASVSSKAPRRLREVPVDPLCGRAASPSGTFCGLALQGPQEANVEGLSSPPLVPFQGKV